MRVLFLSVTAGGGHNATAQAVIGYLRQHTDAEAVMLNTFNFIDPAIDRTIDKGYEFGVRINPKMWGQIYDRAADYSLSDRRTSASWMLRHVLAHRLIRYIRRYAPDIIVSTHCLSALLVDYMRRSGAIKQKSVGILTDFTLHPFWQDIKMDAFVIADERMSYSLCKRGIPKESLRPLGIPIDEKFSRSVPKTQARAILGIEDRNTVLVMSGSFGYGSMSETISALDDCPQDFQIISVCGNNQRTKKRIDAMQCNKKIYNYGFVDNVDVLMDASDCIVTKPGGLTTSEALAKRIPIVMMNPIPGQEAHNAEFLSNHGVALEVRSNFAVDEAVYELLSRPVHVDMMKNMQTEVGKPHAARDVARLLYELCGNTL